MAGAAKTGDLMLTFAVGSDMMALPASTIREVAVLSKLTRVPHSPPALLGVSSIRGAVVPIIEVEPLLKPFLPTSRLIVIEGDEPIGLAVTRVGQLVSGKEAEALTRLDVASLVARAVPDRRSNRAGDAIVVEAKQEGRDESNSRQLTFVMFRVAGQDFALPLAAVCEVIKLPADVARLPHCDAAVVGNVSVRNTTLPLLSLAELLGLPATTVGRHSRIVVTNIAGHQVGLLVDAVNPIAHVAEIDVDALPQVLNRGSAEARIQALCRVDDGARLVSVLAPDHLVREDLMARLLQTGSDGEISKTEDAEKSGISERILLFNIAGASFGLPIAAVEEVVQLPSRLIPLPKQPDFVAGAMKFRGRVIPVIDQSLRFANVPVSSAKPRVIIVQSGELSAGFIVDSVSGIAAVPLKDIGSAPDLGAEETRIFDKVAAIQGYDELVLIIGPLELLDQAKQGIFAESGKKDTAKKA